MRREKTLTILTIVLILSNILDTFLTLKYIKFGPLDEGNPIMAYLLNGDGCLFAFVKIFFVTLFAISLWCKRDLKLAAISIYVTTSFYISLILWWLLVILRI
tara:strand:+ start:1285 stop:1590 length:306 start_codon:yes stop_codon:yes gene_type:complete